MRAPSQYDKDAVLELVSDELRGGSCLCGLKRYPDNPARGFPGNVTHAKCPICKIGGWGRGSACGLAGYRWDGPAALCKDPDH